MHTLRAQTQESPCPKSGDGKDEQSLGLAPLNQLLKQGIEELYSTKGHKQKRAEVWEI